MTIGMGRDIIVTSELTGSVVYRGVPKLLPELHGAGRYTVTEHNQLANGDIVHREYVHVTFTKNGATVYTDEVGRGA